MAYLSVCLFATATLTFFGSNTFFWPAHLAVMLTFFVVVAEALRRESLSSLILSDWGSLCLYAFLAWYLLRASTHGDPQIRAEFLKLFANSIAAGSVIGILAFSDLADRVGHGHSRLWALVTMAAGSTTIAVASIIYFARIRDDLFLIALPFAGASTYYQLFGNYLSLLFICILAAACSLKAWKSRFSGWVWNSLFIACLTFLSMFLAQVAAANKATLLIGLIGGGTMSGYMLAALSARHRRGVYEAAIVATVGTVTFIGAWNVAAGQPPMRMFNFKDTPQPPLLLSDIPLPTIFANRENVAPPSRAAIDAVLADNGEGTVNDLDNSSVESRRRIWRNFAIPQLRLAPLFGDLDVDKEVTGTRGLYLHSLVSIQTHLGLFGTLSILGFLGHRAVRLWSRPYPMVLKVSAPIILLVGIGTSFFTWVPFWFMIGALYSPALDMEAMQPLPGDR